MSLPRVLSDAAIDRIIAAPGRKPEALPADEEEARSLIQGAAQMAMLAPPLRHAPKRTFVNPMRAQWRIACGSPDPATRERARQKMRKLYGEWIGWPHDQNPPPTYALPPIGRFGVGRLDSILANADEIKGRAALRDSYSFYVWAAFARLFGQESVVVDHVWMKKENDRLYDRFRVNARTRLRKTDWYDVEDKAPGAVLAFFEAFETEVAEALKDPASGLPKHAGRFFKPRSRDSLRGHIGRQLR